MITNIALENFKCFRGVSVAPKLVTVFIGPNGTGKTGVLQALLLLKQSRDNVVDLCLDGELMRLPLHAFMLNRQDSSVSNVRIMLGWDSPIDSEEAQGLLNFEVFLEYSSQAALNAYRGLTKWRSRGFQYEIFLDWHNREQKAVTPRGSIVHQVLPRINSFNVISVSEEYQSLPLWEQLSQAPSRALADVRIVPAARGLTRGVYELGPASTDNLSGVSGLGAQEDNTATTLAYSRPEVEKVSDLMKKITGVGFRVDTVPPQSVEPVSESSVGDLSLLVEGFGTNALVHLLFEVVRATPMSTVLIEEPEIHLHPKAQADLASVLVEEAKTCQKQLVMTTHSEHTAGRLLTLVAEGTLSADELAIYSFEKDDAGVCSATEIEVTDQGQVSGGLRSFFETDLDEMRRYVEALRAKA